MDAPDLDELIAWTIAAIGAALFALIIPARAADVYLKGAPMVTGETVTLGDVFDGAGSAAARELAPAPAPGATRSFDPDWLSGEAAAAGLAWRNPDGVLRVTVTRASRLVPGDAVADLVAAALKARQGGRWAVTLDDQRGLHAPAGVDLAPRVLALAHDPRTGAFTADVALAINDAPRRVTGRAEAALDIPVLARPLSRGEVVAAGDIEWLTLGAGAAPANVVADAETLVGMAAKRALRAATPIMRYDVERPAAVEKGEIVSVVYQTGALSLVARARALADAAEGDTIRFVNLQSNRTFEATVEGPGKARVVAASSSFYGGIQ